MDALLEKNEDKEMAEVVRRELKQIDMLVMQMLRFASPKPKRLTSVHVHQVMDHSLQLLEQQTNEQIIALKREYRAIRGGTVRDNDSQLLQKFMNLLLNSFEATAARVNSPPSLKMFWKTTATEWLKIGHLRHRYGHRPGKSGPGVYYCITIRKNNTLLGLTFCRRSMPDHGGHVFESMTSSAV